MIIEPTYGLGNFISSSLTFFSNVQLIYGIEIHREYEWLFKLSILRQSLENKPYNPKVVLFRDNIFEHVFDLNDFPLDTNLLIIGNPPWVTNTDLSATESRNIPSKSNFKKFRGIDALTGKSNFDLSEFIILQLLELFSSKKGKLVMLCKNIVIRNIVKHLPNYSYSIDNILQIPINAKEEFGKSVDASLLIIDLGKHTTNYTCNVTSFTNPNKTLKKFGWVQNKFVSDVNEYVKFKDIDGESTLTWRGGIKHDCAPVLELELVQDTFVNGLKEVLDVETKQIYPLLKGSDLKDFIITSNDRGLIVTQNFVGEKTDYLEKEHPKMFKYLNSKLPFFEKRKSKIYKKNVSFSIFGVGNYSFMPYKVAIAGLYKEPHFSICLPKQNKPFVLDDTCYFIGFNSYSDAVFAGSLLNSSISKEFLNSIVFSDSKRPFTKEVLSRINLKEFTNLNSFDIIQQIWEQHKFTTELSNKDYDNFKKKLSENNYQF